jgi:hypothetical protein
MAVLATIVVLGKQLVIELACVIILSYVACNECAPYCHVACPAVYHFSTSNNQHDLWKKKNLAKHKLCVLILCETFVIVRRIKWDTIKGVCCTWCKATVVIIVGF